MLLKLLQLIRRCIVLAIPFGKKKLAFVASVILVSGIFELFTVFSVLPFLKLATNTPEQMQETLNHPWAQKLIEIFPFVGDNPLLWAGIASIVMLFVTNGLGLLNQVVRVRFGFAFGHTLRTRMMRSLAARPYSYFTSRNSGALLQKTIDDVGRFINEVFLPLLDVISRAVMITFLVLSVLLIYPEGAIGAALLFGTFYFLVFLFIRKHSLRIGAMLRQTNKRIMISAQQFFGSIKTVMVHDKSDYFINQFAENSARQASLLPKARIFSFFPRTIIEPLAFGAIIGIVLWMSGHGQSLLDLLPRLSAMAFVGMRLIPAFQSLYAQLNQVTTMHYTLGELEAEIQEANLSNVSDKQSLSSEAERLAFEKQISLESVSFQYPGAPTPVIKDFNLNIPKKSSVGIIGPTGSGKSTLVDTILGLHEVQAGSLKLDDKVLRKGDMVSWRSIIGYVPQDIYLLDATIEENIAFGIPPEEIDHEQIARVAKAAQIYDFIETELPDKWETAVGERGVRLSGGQRQRIGLARALYTKPEVLILDEATSALDIKTEEEVMKAIDALQGTLTILIVAHRLSTIEACDQVVDLAKLS